MTLLVDYLKLVRDHANPLDPGGKHLRVANAFNSHMGVRNTLEVCHLNLGVTGKEVVQTSLVDHELSDFDLSATSNDVQCSLGDL